MLDLIADIGSSEIIVQSTEVVFDFLLSVSSTLLRLLLDIPLVETGNFEWLNVGTEPLEFDKLGFSGGFPGVHEDRRGDATEQNFRWLALALVIYRQ